MACVDVGSAAFQHADGPHGAQAFPGHAGTESHQPHGHEAMHRSRLGQIIIDCKTDLDAGTRFWSAALGRPAVRLQDPADASYRALTGAPREPRILLQQVEHPSRVHLDIETDDVDAEVARLESLGARRVARVRQWWVLEAPTGHRFCVLPPQRDDFPGDANAWP
jgi:hypothetical protein